MFGLIDGRTLGLVSVVAVGCGPQKPPADFAPDPGLAVRIASIRIDAAPFVCPGAVIGASYTAVLDDGTELGFSRRYDKDDPPPLHVVMLRRTSPEATPRENGDWGTVADPLQSAATGFRLHAFLAVRPGINASATVAPDYSCARREWVFRGRNGPRGGGGENGPDITARIGIVSSPFYERLLVVGVEVGVAPPFFVLADADRVPPADWLVLVSQGGRGGRGVKGSAGTPGADGKAGCPGAPGGAGAPGGPGGGGGRGGRGGRVTVVAPVEEPFLAGLVDARSPGGRGGAGGPGGPGGAGGKGGTADPATDRRCQAGADGAAGAGGADGRDGPDGAPGPAPAILTVPLADVFGPGAPPELLRLLGSR